MQTIQAPFVKEPSVAWDAAGQAGVLGALALMWIAPFLWTSHRFPLAALDSELVAAWCLGFGLLSCGALARRDVVLQWPLPCALIVLSAIALVQLGLGWLAYTQQAIRFFLLVGTMLAAYVLGRQLIAAEKSRDATDLISVAALIGGLFSALVQWLQLFDIEVFPFWLAIVYDDPALRSRPFASLAQANHQTTYLAL